MLIFAYGSNLHWRQIVRRCPSVKVHAAGVLIDHRLAFVGHSQRWDGAVATVVPDVGKFAFGMIYRMNREDLRRLDQCEGTPRVYSREPCYVNLIGTRRAVEVDTYFLDRKFGKPSPEYAATIREGYRRWGFDPKHVRNAIRYSERRWRKQLESDGYTTEVLDKLDEVARRHGLPLSTIIHYFEIEREYKIVNQKQAKGKNNGDSIHRHRDRRARTVNGRTAGTRVFSDRRKKPRVANRENARLQDQAKARKANHRGSGTD